MRANEGGIGDNDIYFINDCGKDGNKQVLLAGFLDVDGKNTPKQVRNINITFSENSMQDRLDRVRGFSTINQCERIHGVTKNVMDLTPHDRLHFPGSSNRGNFIGPVSMQSWASPCT